MSPFAAHAPAIGVGASLSAEDGGKPLLVAHEGIGSRVTGLIDEFPQATI